MSTVSTNNEPGRRPVFFNRYEAKYLWLIFALWIVYGQLIAFGIAEKYIYDAVFSIWDSALRYVPAIMRLKDVYSFGVDLARLQATAMLISTPVLFILMLAVNVEGTVHGVRVKKKEALVISIMLFAVVMPLVSGFGYAGPGKIFHSNFYWYSAFIATMTHLLMYVLRLVICLVANK